VAGAERSIGKLDTSLIRLTPDIGLRPDRLRRATVIVVATAVLAAAAALADRPGAGGAIAIFGLAAALTVLAPSLAVALAVPGFLFDHALSSPYHPTLALAAGLAAGALAGGLARPMARHWRLLLAPAALLAWVGVSYAAPGTGGITDGHARSDLTSFACALVLLPLALAAPPGTLLLVGITAVSASAAGWLAVAFGSSYDVDHRIAAFGLNPVFLGLGFAFGAVACAVILERRTTLLVILAVPGIVAGIAGTQTRSALIVSGVGLIATAALWAFGGRRVRYARRADRLLMAALVVAGLLLITVPALGVGGGGVGRPAKELAHDNAARSTAGHLAWRVAIDHPGRGVGLGRFPVIAETRSGLGVPIGTHDEYLRLAAETGFLGLVLFLVAVAYLVFAPGRRYLDELALVAAFLVALLFANLLFSAPVAAMFWAVLGARAGRASAADATAAARPG
jgi:hypothetical protein